MDRNVAPPGPSSGRTGPTPEELRWLHDKYERLAAEEGGLTSTRTSYFAAIGTVLVTGLVVAAANLVGHPLLLAALVSFLAGLGILISAVWAVLLSRTAHAQELWREAALRLEQRTMLFSTGIAASIALRNGGDLDVDLTRPYEAHALRFSASGGGTWIDRLDPSTLMEILPLAFIGIWGGTLIVVWTWLLVLQ